MWQTAIQYILMWLTGLGILALITKLLIGEIPLPLRIHIILVGIIITGLEIKRIFKPIKTADNIEDDIYIQPIYIPTTEEKEKIFLNYYREANKLMISDKIENYAKYIIEETKLAMKEKETLRIENIPVPQKPASIKQQTKYNIRGCTTFKCDGAMQIRTGKDGKQYWVCSEYNKCKTAVAVEEAGA